MQALKIGDCGIGLYCRRHEGKIAQTAIYATTLASLYTHFLSSVLDWPHDNTPHLIVAGAGPAGCGAALAAARTGVSTTLIEYHPVLGGMGTAGLVNNFARPTTTVSALSSVVSLVKSASA